MPADSVSSFAVDGNVRAAGAWYCWDSGRGDAAFNMALDEALLEAMPRLGRPVLRFYGWTQPAASFGYFQKHSQVEEMTPLRPLVRRPTGGGIVPHDADWTYSLVFPPGHQWYDLPARESYRRVHEWIQSAFAHLDLAADLAAAAMKPQPGQCFIGHEQSDLLWRGRKVAGAAQRRRRDGLLIQGSVQPPLPSLDRSSWEQAMLKWGYGRCVTTWEHGLKDELIEWRARELVQSKYAQTAYNRQR